MDNNIPFVASKSRWTPEEELNYLIELAQDAAEFANEGQGVTRRIAPGAAAVIAERTFDRYSHREFSVKKHMVLTAISHFAALTQKNKVITASAAHTDLLPIAHPQSTRSHNLHPLQLRQVKARWFIDDPKITDPTVRALVSSALLSDPDSAEEAYARKRLETLNYVPVIALTAAMKPGANNFYWMVQLRDRLQRFAEMGGGASAYVMDQVNRIRRMMGTVVGAKSDPKNKSDSSNYFVIETDNDELTQLPASATEMVKAIIPSQKTPDGMSKTPARVPEGVPVLKQADLVKMEAPPGYERDESWSPDESEVEYYGTRADLGTMYTDGNYRVRKFNKARDAWLARDDFEVAQQRESEGQDVVAIGRGPNGSLDLNRPVYFVSRDDDRGNRVFAAVQNWADAMAFVRQDQPRYEKDELPSPERNPRFANPNDEEAAGRAPSNAPIPSKGAPTRRRTPSFRPVPEGRPRRRRSSSLPQTANTRKELNDLPAGTVVEQSNSPAFLPGQTFSRKWVKNEDGTWDEIIDGKRVSGASFGDGPTPRDEITRIDGNIRSDIRILEESAPKAEAPRSPEAPAAEAPKAPSGLRPSVSAEEIQNIKEQSIIEAITEEGRFPLPREATANHESDIQKGARRDYQKVYDLLSERDPEFTKKYPDMDSFWNEVRSLGVHGQYRAFDSQDMIPEETKVFNRAYAEAVLGMDPDGEIVVYRNAINLPLSVEKAGVGYWSTDKDFAQAYGASPDRVEASKNGEAELNGFYEGRFRPDQINGMIGYSQVEDEFAVVISPDTAEEPGRVTRIGPLDPPKIPEWLNLNSIKGLERQGGTVFRHFNLAGALNLNKVDKNPLGDGDSEDFLKENGLEGSSWREEFDKIWGAGSYDEMIDEGDIPPYSELKRLFVQDDDGKWFLDVENIAGKGLYRGYSGSGNPDDYKNDRFDSTLKVLETIQTITGEEFMSVKRDDVPEPREMPERDKEEPITDIEEPAGPEAIDELPEGGEIEVEEVAPEPEAAPAPPPDGPPPGGEDGPPPRPPRKDPKDMSYDELKEEFETPLPADATEEDYERYSQIAKAFYAMGGYARTDTRRDPKDMSWEELKEEYETPLPADATDADYARNAEIGREFYNKGGYAGPLPEESEGPEFTPDELAVGYGATKDSDGSYSFEGEGADGGTIIVEQLPDGRWNVRYYNSDPSGQDVIDQDIAQFDTPEEAFDAANLELTSPREFDPEEATRDRDEPRPPYRIPPTGPTGPTGPSGTGDDGPPPPPSGGEAPVEEAPEIVELPSSTYIPRGPTEGQTSPDFTDDPVELAQKYSRDELVGALKEALDGDSDFANLPFADGDEPVPAEAVFEAIRMARRPAPESGPIPQQSREAQRESLNKRIADLIQSGDISRDDKGRFIPGTPEAEEVIEQSDELDAFEDQDRGLEVTRDELPPLLQSLSYEELGDYLETGDYRPFLTPNDDFTDVPENFHVMDPTPSDAQDLVPNSYPDQLANNFTTEELQTQLRDAIRSGSGYGLLGIENEAGEVEEMRVPAEALRDALKLRGEDTNEFIRSVVGEQVKPPVPTRAPKPRAERTKATDEAPKATAAYMFKNGRAYIAQRLGKIISNNPEVRQYLDDNGFKFDNASKYETAEMSEADFYNFMRGLRDDFGVDLIPGKGQESIDFDRDPAPKTTPTAASNGITVPDSSVDALQGLVNRRDELDAQIADSRTSAEERASLERTRATVQKNIDKIRGVDNGEGPRRVNIPTSGLQEGDITQSDFFTIISIESIGTSNGREFFRVTGYYPGGERQSTKEWQADTEIPIYRGIAEADRPQEGDLPAIRQPKSEDFVGVPFKGNRDQYERVEDYAGRGRPKWVPADPAKRAAFDSAYDAYLEELDSRMAQWNAPPLDGPDQAPQGEATPAVPTRSVETTQNRDVQPGDIIYTKNADGSVEAFVVENVKVKPATVIQRTIRRKVDTPAGEGQTGADPQRQQWLDEVRQAHPDIDNEDSAMRVGALVAALSDEILNGRAKIDRKTRVLKSGDKAMWLTEQINNVNNGRDVDLGGDAAPEAETFEETVVDVPLGVDKVEITGYYPGYASQKLSRKADSVSTVVRGETSLPEKGESALPKRPNPLDPDYQDKLDARNAAIREASKDYPVTPEELDAIKARQPYQPDQRNRPISPAFNGRIAEIIEEDEIKTGAELRERLKQERVVYFDFETVGTGDFDSENPDAPIALAARIYENGELVETVRLFMNPGERLSNYYYTSAPKNEKNQYVLSQLPENSKLGVFDRRGKLTIFQLRKGKWVVEGDEERSYGARELTNLYKGQLIQVGEDNNPIPREDRMKDAEGNPITDEWLATQPGIKEQLSAFINKIGSNPILVAYNGEFDVNTLSKWAERLGIDYTPNGYIDPMGIRRSFTDGQGVKNRLEDTARDYGIERDDLHNAEADVEVTVEVFDRMLDEIPDFDLEFDPKARREKYEYDKAKWDRDWERYEIEKERLEQAKKSTPTDDVQTEEATAAAKTRAKKNADAIPNDRIEVSETDRTSESLFGDDVNTEWFKDDENAFNVKPAGEATFADVIPGDGIATENGQYNEVVDVLPNPDSPSGAVILHRDLETNRLYETRVADKATKLTGPALRRRVELDGATTAEVRQLANAAQKRKKAAAQRNTKPGKPTVKPATPAARKKSADIDNAVEKGAPTPEVEKPEKEGSFRHLDANNLPLAQEDKVRNIKDPESGVGVIVRVIDDGNVRAKFPDSPTPYKRKPHKVSTASLEMVDMAEGGRRVDSATKKAEAAKNKTTKDRQVEAITPDSPEGMSRRIRSLAPYLVNGPGYNREIGDSLKRASRALSQGNLKEAQYWINEAEAADKRLKQRNRDTESLRTEYTARKNSLLSATEDPAFTPVVQRYVDRAEEFFNGGDTRKALAELTKAEDSFFAYGDTDVQVLETGDERPPEGSNRQVQQAYRLFAPESMAEAARLEKDGVAGKTALKELTSEQARQLLLRVQTDYEVENKAERIAELIAAAEAGDYEQFEELGFALDFDRQKYLDSKGRSPEGKRSRDLSNEPEINEVLEEFRKQRQAQEDNYTLAEQQALEEEQAASKAAAQSEGEPPAVTHVIAAGELLPGDTIIADGDSESPIKGVVSRVTEMPDLRFRVDFVDSDGNTKSRTFNGSDIVEILPEVPETESITKMNYGPPGDNGDGDSNRFGMALPSDSEDPGEDTANDVDRPASQGSEDDFADLEVPPTKEQRDILDAALAGKSIGVTAVAGSGKSTTLRLLANVLKSRQPGKRLVYLAFGRDIRAEAETKMPDNTEVRTTNSIAYAGVDETTRKKMNQQSEREIPYISSRKAIARELGIEQTTLSMDGNSEEYAPERLAKVVIDAVRNFTISADDEIDYKHFDSRFDEIPAQLLQHAKDYWADITTPVKMERVEQSNGNFENVLTEGKFKIDNDHILKMWALSRPDIFSGDSSSGLKKKGAVDIILIDEAQDINPVVGKVLADQKGQKIYVGDSAQAIYGFRGANDELDKAPVDVKLTLTQSFRFGTGVAGVANRILSLIGSNYRVRGSDRPSKINEGIQDPDAILVRENQEGIALSEQLLADGKRVEISEETYTNYMSLLASARWLLRGSERPKPFNMHDDLDIFEDWNEFGEAIGRREARSGAQFYRMVNNYIQTYGTSKGFDKLEEFLGGLTISSKDLKPAADYKGVSLKDVRPGSIGNLIKNKKENGILDYFITPSGQVMFRQSPQSSPFKRVWLANNERRKAKLRKLGFEWNPDAEFPGAPIPDGKKKSGAWVRKLSEEEVLAGRTEAEPLGTNEREALINRAGRLFNGHRETDEPTILITTAHKAKGLEWSKVKISEGFKEYGAEFDPTTGQFKMPSPEEMNLLYVAATRAMDELDIGGGGWIYSLTEDEEEEFMFPDEEENRFGMSIPVESTTPEEFTKDVKEARTKSEQIADQISALIIEAIEKGDLPPWQVPWSESGGFLPTSVATGKAYQGSNIAILWAKQQINGWKDNRWITFAGAKDLGGNVIKGSKGTTIYNWSPVYKEIEKPDGTKEKVVAFMRPKAHTVFNVEQVEGIDLPELEIPEPLPVSEAEALVLERYKDAPEIRNNPQNEAYWTGAGDYISLPERGQFPTQEAYLEALFHELVHSTGHKSRLDRSELMDNYGKHRASRGEEELIAEIGASILAARVGVNLDHRQIAAYAKSWLAPLNNDTGMIVRATRQAQKAVDYILGDSEPNLGTAGVSGEDVPQVLAQKLGLDLPQSYVGDYGRSGEEIAADATGVDTLRGEFQPGTPNSGTFANGIQYDIDMHETRLTSGRTTGEQYGVRRMTLSGNTYPNREAIKAAGFKYDPDTKTWKKNYLREAFPVERLTQEVVDRNPSPELVSDLETLEGL